MIEHSPQRTVDQSERRENDRDTDYLSPVNHGAALLCCDRTALWLLWRADRLVERLPTECPIMILA
jgi:hypothetical protein